MNWPAYIVSSLCWICVGFIIGIVVTYTDGRDQMRYEAVSAGAATWEADENGKPVFAWKVPE